MKEIRLEKGERGKSQTEILCYIAGAFKLLGVGFAVTFAVRSDN